MLNDRIAGLMIFVISVAFVLGWYTVWHRSTARYEARLASCRGPIFKVPLRGGDIGTYQAVTSDLSGQIYMMEPYTPPSKRFVMKGADGKRRKK